MTSENERIVQITNKFRSPITVITVTNVTHTAEIEGGHSRTYQLQSQGVVLRWNDTKLEIVLIGTSQDNSSQSTGMCICIIPGVNVGIQVEQSMNITIRSAHTVTAAGGMPDAVGCGDDF